MNAGDEMRGQLRQMIAVLQAERQALAGLDLDAIMGAAHDKVALCGTLDLAAPFAQASQIDEECRGLLDAARQEYLQGASRLYVCNAAPCCERHGFDVSDRGLGDMSSRIGVPVSKTGCQGHCKQAPVVALRIGEQSQIFGRMHTNADRLTMTSFVKAAAKAGSFLVPSAGVDEFRYDPVHRDRNMARALRPVRFLLGHFRGEGRFARSSDIFQKELFGTSEASGRFVALRMEATYPLPEGGNDVHRALVIVGSEGRSGAITGHAFTDGGSVREYRVEQSQFALQFEDDSPDHGQHWRQARKTLKPTDEGYEELLEVDSGDGFTPFYTVLMKRVPNSVA